MTTKRIRQIMTPNPHDVLLGRGGFTTHHEGNVNFRKWVGERKGRYQEANDKNLKSEISQEIYSRVKALVPPGRFLSKGGTKHGKIYWIEVDDSRAISKTKQALRDGVSSNNKGRKKRKTPEGMINSFTPNLTQGSKIAKVHSSSTERVLRSTRLMDRLQISNLIDAPNSCLERTDNDDKSTQQFITTSKDNDILIPVTPDDVNIYSVQYYAFPDLDLPIEQIEYTSTNFLLNHKTENDLVSEDSAKMYIAPLLQQLPNVSSITPELSNENHTLLLPPTMDKDNIYPTTAINMTTSLKLNIPKPTFTRRANSLTLSEISMDETIDQPEYFTNPFDDDKEIFDVIHGLLGFPLKTSYIDEDQVDAGDTLSYDPFEATSPSMSPYKSNIGHSPDGMNNFSFDFGMDMGIPMTLNVIENEDAIESLDHDLTAWMKL